jgi:hypothetical protein
MNRFFIKLLHRRCSSTSTTAQWYFEKNAANANQRDLQVLSMAIRATMVAAAVGATAGTMAGIYQESRSNPTEYKYQLAWQHARLGAQVGAAAIVFAPLWIPSVCIGMPLGRIYARAYRQP